jgi:hypothetical protein
LRGNDREKESLMDFFDIEPALSEQWNHYRSEQMHNVLFPEVINKNENFDF